MTAPRFNPYRDVPRTWAELLAWTCVRLERGDTAASARRTLTRSVDPETGEDFWTMGSNCAPGRAPRPLHKPEIVDLHEAYADAIELAETEEAARARSSRDVAAWYDRFRLGPK